MKKQKRYGFLFAALAVSLLTLLWKPETGLTALSFTGKNFLNFLFMLTPIFICIGLVDVWIERETMIKIMGEKSGVRGALVALMMGMVTAVPLYALLPVAGVLLHKGSKMSNVLIFLTASASVRIPLLLFEISSLGWRFTFARFGLNIIVVFAIAFLIDRLLTDSDKPAQGS